MSLKRTWRQSPEVHVLRVLAFGAVFALTLRARAELLNRFGPEEQWFPYFHLGEELLVALAVLLGAAAVVRLAFRELMAVEIRPRGVRTSKMSPLALTRKPQKRARSWVAAERRARIAQRGWPNDVVDRVIARTVALGMEAEMVRFAWGRPSRANRTITSSGVQEEWVYDGDPAHRVLLRDGVVVELTQSAL